MTCDVSGAVMSGFRVSAGEATESWNCPVAWSTVDSMIGNYFFPMPARFAAASIFFFSAGVAYRS